MAHGKVDHPQGGQAGRLAGMVALLEAAMKTSMWQYSTSGRFLRRAGYSPALYDAWASQVPGGRIRISEGGTPRRVAAPQHLIDRLVELYLIGDLRQVMPEVRLIEGTLRAHSRAAGVVPTEEAYARSVVTRRMRYGEDHYRTLRSGGRT